MWKNFIICVSAMAVLSGCGNAVGEAGDGSIPVADTPRARGDYRPNQPIGRLYTSSPNTKVAAVEARLSTYLKGDVSRVNFAKDTVPYLQSAGGSRPPLNLNVRGLSSRQGLNLVIRHLEPVAINDISGLFLKPCETGSVYTGYAAANPSLDVYLETETGPFWNWAIPYGIVVCDKGEDFDVLALPIEHKIFAEDSKRTETLKALPKDHPLSGAL